MEKVTSISPKTDLSRDNLPDELLVQLKKTRGVSPETQSRLIKIIGDLDQEANLDNILISYYRLHNEVLKRNGLITRLNNMADKGLIKKSDVQGYYTK